jgi:hypothetical protein
VIIISNSDEEMVKHEETTAKAEATPSAAVEKSSTPAASPADADEDLKATPNDSNNDLAPGQAQAIAALAEMKPARLRPSHQEQLMWQACFKDSHVQHCYPSFSFVHMSWDGDAESLLSLMSFMPL